MRKNERETERERKKEKQKLPQHSFSNIFIILPMRTILNNAL